MPDFREGWPTTVIGGFHVMRSAFYWRSHEEDERGLRWTLAPALVSDGQGWAVIGELTVRTANRFAGVQILASVSFADEPSLDEGGWERANSLLELHAGWLTHPIYDFAAQVMRTSVAGTSIKVPRDTPEYELKLADPNSGEMDVLLD